MKEVIQQLRIDSRVLEEENAAFTVAKRTKARVEEGVLREIVKAVSGSLPSISTRAGNHRGIQVVDGIWLDDKGQFFTLDNRGAVQWLGEHRVLKELPPVAVVMVLIAAIRNQTGKLTARTAEVEHELRVLEGIELAFKAGGVR